ncbi:MAG: prephenate dehydrogenase/arogenate dehydrogenase family protein [Deltaproteobacteria bacterium]|nr:prephenate dehydrogenase/arogenate dehydrogenase family protein [Deltaproteobacteria bacterium]
MSKAPKFERVAIFGVGLIGGSFAMELKRFNLASHIVGVGRGQENLETAMKLGIVDSITTDPLEAVKDADLIFLAVPVNSMGALVEKFRGELKIGAIITDGGSVKEKLIDEVSTFIPEGVHFVPGHPIAGTEHSGAEAAFIGLYKDKKCILTPTDNTDKEAVETVKALWEAMGSTVIFMEPKRHDIVFGAVSHLPHVIAYALVNSVSSLEKEKFDVMGFGAGGFKSTTRIASSSPEMWSDICTMNKDAVLRCIDVFQKVLLRIKDDITEGDNQSLVEEFDRAKKSRDSFIKADE